VYACTGDRSADVTRGPPCPAPGEPGEQQTAGPEAAYLKIYREIAQIFRYPTAHQALMEASNEWEVIRVLEGHVE
jgi:hypothetical protein